MNLIEFTRHFPNDEACKKHLKALRERQGIVCNKCGCVHHYWKGSRNGWECRSCGHRTSLTCGTVMHGTKLPLMYWFVAIHLLTSTKKSISASEMQRQLGHKRYQPVWEMLHKLREAMGKRDSRYSLSGEIELDEGFFTVDYDANAQRHRGRGSEAKTKVLVMAESRETEGSKRKGVSKQVGYIKMQVIPNLKADTIDEALMGSVEPETALTTDGSNSYTHFGEMVDGHRSQVIPPKEVGKVLPWVHIVISNAKREILDVFHSVSGELIQNYLNEFCYRFNRRYCDKFERLMVSSVEYQNSFMHRTYEKRVA